MQFAVRDIIGCSMIFDWAPWGVRVHAVVTRNLWGLCIAEMDTYSLNGSESQNKPQTIGPFMVKKRSCVQDGFRSISPLLTSTHRLQPNNLPVLLRCRLLSVTEFCSRAFGCRPRPKVKDAF